LGTLLVRAAGLGMYSKIAVSSEQPAQNRVQILWKPA
jgi:hypothetical protein